MRKVIGGIVASALVLTVVGTAVAAWTIDPDTGIGFVGKGDVQLALGLNNKGLQQAAGNLVFSYTDEVTYAVPCMKEVGSGDINYNTFSRTRGVNSEVEYDARTRNQVNGFILKGFDGEGEISGDPATCPGGWQANGTPTIVGASGGGLSVNGVPLQ